MFAVLFGVFAALCWSILDVIARTVTGAVGGFRTAAWVMVSGFILLVWKLYRQGPRLDRPITGIL
jgi:hypothetical protein